MNAEQFLLSFMSIVMVIGAPVFIYFGFVKPNLQGWENRQKPVITIPATVVGKAENMDNVIYAGSSARFNGAVHFLIFRTNDGLEVTLTVPRDDYYNLKEGTTGTLTYQGTKCEIFTPDKL